MPQADSTARFSNRVENYIRYRPGYPKGVLEVLRDECRLSPDSVVADIASGTGIFTRMQDGMTGRSIACPEAHPALALQQQFSKRFSRLVRTPASIWCGSSRFQSSRSHPIERPSYITMSASNNHNFASPLNRPDSAASPGLTLESSSHGSLLVIRNFFLIELTGEFSERRKATPGGRRRQEED